MTTTSTLRAESKHPGFRIPRPSDAKRYMIAGIVLLVVAVSSLIGVVTDWSQVATPGFVDNHHLQIILATLGGALVIGGIVKSRRTQR